MKPMTRPTLSLLLSVVFLYIGVLLFAATPQPAIADDLPAIKKAGVLRHLGVPYANFVTGSGDGLDVELIKLFAEHLGVKYQYVETDWANVITDLTGQKIRVSDGQVTIIGEAPVRGDLIASGMTIIPWRRKMVDFSHPTFPTQVWLTAKANSTMMPITPTGDVKKDIALTKESLRNISTLGKLQTCLDPDLYSLADFTSKITLFDGPLNELAPAMIGGVAESSILDVPDALIALEKWPGQLKVIGPVSVRQEMAAAFAKSSPKLRNAFNSFFEKIRTDGTYNSLVRKYYDNIFSYYPDFFATRKTIE